MDFQDLNAPKKLLVATDLSARSERALKRAILLAGELGASLEILHIVDDALPTSIVETYEEAARETVNQLLRAIPGTAAHKPTVTFLRGEGYREILLHAQEHNIDLIVLGITRHNLASLFTGTTAERIIRIGEIPVLMAKNAAERPYQRVVVASDNSPSAARALFTALAVAPQAEFCCVHVAHVPFKGWLGQEAHQRLRSERDEAFKDKLAAQISEAATRLGIAAPTPTVAIEEGAILNVIHNKIAKFQPDLVVLGTHGRATLHQALIGSLAQTILSDPPADVLIAKA